MMLFSAKHQKLYRDYFAARQRENKNSDRPHKWQVEFERIAEELGAVTALDYGCGPSANLAAYSRRSVDSYDPAIPQFAQCPDPFFDLVVCNHVLEHVEPECLDDVLGHIKSLTETAALIAVSTKPSTKKLSDGTDWHTIVRDREWWLDKFEEVLGANFDVVSLNDPETEVAILWRA